ncbi:hypothetical protein GCG54_00011125, partial [Colletotrichum gloeosporioides]
NPSIPAFNTLIHAPRQDFGDFGVIASTTNPFVWKFPNTKVWIGSETLFPIPEEVQTLWARIKGGLLVTLEAVEGEMMREQSQEASLRKRHVQRRRFMTELRMSGCCQKHETGKDRKVTLYPCVWILCGSKWCRDKIRKVTERLELPQNLSSQRIEVHEGGPTFNASEVNIPRSQLDNDRALVSGVAHSGGTILHHIEVAPKQECRSICGMLCCTTFVKDGNVIDQHVSRIGGVLTESFFGLDYKIWPLALTTAHGIFDLLLSEASDDSELTSGSGKSKYLQPSASGSYSSDSESVYDTDEESSRSEAEIEILGNRNASSVTKWTPLEDVVGINFMGERLSSEQVFDRGTPADYTILRSDTLNSCRNLISSDPSVEVTTFVLNSNLTPGPVSLIIGIDEVSEASLLPDIVKMPWRQKALLVRKLYTSAPLAPGTSGMWVCRGSAFCGMIVAIYPGEPLALFMTAEDLLQDMGTSFPVSRQPSVLNLLPSHTSDEPEASDAIRNDLDRESTLDETLPRGEGSGSFKRQESSRTGAKRGSKSGSKSSSKTSSKRYEFQWVWTCVSTDSQSSMKVDRNPTNRNEYHSVNVVTVACPVTIHRGVHLAMSFAVRIVPFNKLKSEWLDGTLWRH